MRGRDLRRILFCVIIGASAFICCGDTIEIPSTDVPKSIPDRGSATSTLTTSHRSSIADLNVKLNITHTFDSDLSVYLIAPDGSRIEMFSSVDGSGDNFTNTILDDEATTAITVGAAPFSGSYWPMQSLNFLDGRKIAGTWKLETTDSSSGDTGTLNSWSLIITEAADIPPTLSDSLVVPLSGTTSDKFYFLVDYFDADGDAPAVKDIQIGEKVYPMSFYTGSAGNGTYLCGPVYLPVGSRSYHFSFTDGHGGSATLPATGSFPGPAVYGDFIDFAAFAEYWRATNCSAPDRCGYSDMNYDGKVDFKDLKIFMKYWLEVP